MEQYILKITSRTVWIDVLSFENDEQSNDELVEYIKQNTKVSTIKWMAMDDTKYYEYYKSEKITKNK